MPEPVDHEASAPGALVPRSRRGRWIVAGILLLALALRVGVVLESRNEYAPQTDALHYDLVATSIANGDGYGDAAIPPMKGPSAFRAPLYAATLASVYVVFGDHSWTWARIMNGLIGTIAVALLGLVAAQLWSRRMGAIAMLLAAVYPPMILVGTSLQHEPLLVALMLGTIAAALQHRRSPRGLWWPIVAGVLLGLAILTRELGFILLPPIAWLLWTGRPRWARPSLAAPAALLVVAFLVVIPWTIRNAVKLDAFVPVSTSSGYGLSGTYNETAMNDRAQWIGPHLDPTTADVILDEDDPTEVNLDRDLRDASLEFIGDHPTYPVQVAFWNSVRLFDLDGGDYNRFISEFVPYPLWLTRLSIYSGYLMLVLAAVGAFLRPTRRVPLAIWWIPVLTYVFMVFTLPASVRYRASLEPFFVLLATVTVATAAAKLTSGGDARHGSLPAGVTSPTPVT